MFQLKNITSSTSNRDFVAAENGRRAAAWVQSVLGPARVKYLADRAAHAAPDHGGGFAAGWRGYVLGVPDLEAVNAVYWEARLAAKFQGDLRTALEEAAVDGLI